jgi:hypothetical protein
VQPEEYEAEIVFFEQEADGTAGSFFAFGKGGLHFSESLAEIIQQFPAG